MEAFTGAVAGGRVDGGMGRAGSDLVSAVNGSCLFSWGASWVGVTGSCSELVEDEDSEGPEVSSTSCVPCQKLLSRLLRTVFGDRSGRISPGEKKGSGCERGMVAVTPLIGSVSSCSGEGSAKGATETRAAAKRIAAAVAVASAGGIGMREPSKLA